MNPITPDICIYHAPCMDGFGAAYAVWRRFGDAVRYVPATYGDPLPEEVGDKHVVIVDFSYKAPVLRSLAVAAASVTILDHHKTAIEDLAHVPDAGITWDSHHPVGWGKRFDLHRSGAVLAWDFFHAPEPAPQLLLHVQDRDLWKFHLDGTREVNAFLASCRYEFAAWDSLARARVSSIRGLGQAILRKEAKDLGELIPLTQRLMVLCGTIVPVANLPYTMASEAGEIMSRGKPFSATYYDGATHRVFSLRSHSDGEDVSAVARHYGGGGHRHAAGFRMPIGWEGDAS
jgi:oligoribonuclease NrnB/cAMP/cGMP phosphodiesterase (DHH superfamily)